MFLSHVWSYKRFCRRRRCHWQLVIFCIIILSFVRLELFFGRGFQKPLQVIFLSIFFLIILLKQFDAKPKTITGQMPEQSYCFACFQTILKPISTSLFSFHHRQLLCPLPSGCLNIVLLSTWWLFICFRSVGTLLLPFIARLWERHGPAVKTDLFACLKSSLS